MGKFQQLVQALADKYDLSEDEVESLMDSSLARDEVKEFNKVKAERDEFERKLNSIESKPKRLEAFKKAGVDLDDLRPAELRELEAFEDFEDADKLKALVVELELPTLEVEEEEEPAAASVAAQAQGNTGRARTSRVTPQDVSGWNHDKMRQFAIDHPQEWEALKRGEEVTGVTA